MVLYIHNSYIRELFEFQSKLMHFYISKKNTCACQRHSLHIQPRVYNKRYDRSLHKKGLFLNVGYTLFILQAVDASVEKVTK